MSTDKVPCLLALVSAAEKEYKLLSGLNSWLKVLTLRALQASSCAQMHFYSLPVVTVATVVNKRRIKHVPTKLLSTLVISSACLAIARHNVRWVHKREDPVSANRA